MVPHGEKESMQTVTEQEARAIMKNHGWSYKERTPHKSGIKYLYAKKWHEGTTIERYICPLSRLAELTEAKLVEKLAPEQEPTEETSSENHEPQVSDTSGPSTHTDEL